MVAQCIAHTPDDPVPFMLDFLEKKRVKTQDELLSNEEKTRLERENEELHENVAKMKSQMQKAAALAADDQEEESEEEEDSDDDDDVVDEIPERPYQARGPRQSVSAEAYGEWNTKKLFVPPVIIKTDEQKERLKNCLCRSFLFANLEENDLGIVIGAMKELQASVDDVVIKQGDNGDCLYVIESGTLKCKINGVGYVKTCERGDVVGELAILYNCPRAASVVAFDSCVLWQLDRDTFNHIVKDAAQKKRERYDAFLQKVPLLASMDAYERSQLADALVSENFTGGTNIMTQGEVGNKFYVLEEGKAFATKDGRKVMSYGVGDYFGELALIKNQPRAASVTADGQAKVVSLDSRSLKRLLNINDLLDRSSKYT